MSDRSLVYEVLGVSKTYVPQAGLDKVCSVQALREISFEIYQGDIVAITGPSGSGKSSLLHILGGMDTPGSGSVRLFLDDFSRKKERIVYSMENMGESARAKLRYSAIGFVYQAFHLVPALTAWENVVLPLMFAGS